MKSNEHKMGQHVSLAERTGTNALPSPCTGISAGTDRYQHLQQGVELLRESIQGVTTLEDLGTGIVTAIAGYLAADMAALYLDYGLESYLLEGSYEGIPGFDAPLEILPADPSIAAAIAGKNPSLFRHFGNLGEMELQSLGHASFQALLWPLADDGELHGILELRFVATATPGMRRYLKKAAPVIVTELVKIKQVEKTQELLNVTQHQADALDRQKVELTEQARQLELVSENKSKFLAQVSHELRTPLNAMMVLSQLLTENPSNPTAVANHAKTINACGGDLLNLINDLLDLAKVEAGKLEFQSEAIELDAFAGGLEATMRPLADIKGLDFVVETTEVAGRQLYSDSHRLHQVLRNLVSNAIKFTKHGQVQVRFGSLADIRAPGGGGFAPCNDPENCLAITVRDSGVGIAPDKQELIFEEFSQVRRGNQLTHQGTGLGLGICLKLAEGLGGRIILESQENQGSTFTLLLPWAEVPANMTTEPEFVQSVPLLADEPEPADSMAPAAGLGDLSGLSILVAGDDMKGVFELAISGQERQANVATAVGVDEACRCLAAGESWDLVLVKPMSGGSDPQSWDILITAADVKGVPYRELGPDIVPANWGTTLEEWCRDLVPVSTG